MKENELKCERARENWSTCDMVEKKKKQKIKNEHTKQALDCITASLHLG